MKSLKLVVLIAAIALVPLGLGMILLKQSGQAQLEQDDRLESEAGAATARLRDSIAETRATVLITAHNPAFRDFYRTRGDRYAKIVGEGRTMDRVNGALLYLSSLYPESIVEASFIHGGGAENARVVRGSREAPHVLADDVSHDAFLQPALALASGHVHQSRPHISRNAGEWVVSYSTQVPRRVGSALVHVEQRVESLRRELGVSDNRFEIAVVDARTGVVVLDSRSPQQTGSELGALGDSRFRELAGVTNDSVRKLDNLRAVYRRLGVAADSENDWIVVASAPRVRAASLVGVNSLPIALALLGVLLIGAAMARRWARTSKDALTDALTGLGKRRKLVDDLARETAPLDSRAAARRPDLRPRRLQALQRRLRAPGRRRTAGAARTPAARGDRQGRIGLPTWRRRVLRDRAARCRRHRPAGGENDRSPLRVRRRLRRRRLVRRRCRGRRAEDGRSRPARRRPAPLCEQVERPPLCAPPGRRRAAASAARASTRNARPTCTASATLSRPSASAWAWAATSLTSSGRPASCTISARALVSRANVQATELEAGFARGRTIALLMASNPSFSDFYAVPGTRARKIAAHGPLTDRVHKALTYLETLYPGQIGEACFIDRGGVENARVVRGAVAPSSELSNESQNAFFQPSVAQPLGGVYQSPPYVSPDTGEWVISNATPIAGPSGATAAIVHFELTIDSFRNAAAQFSGGDEVAIVNADTGAVVVNSRRRQQVGAKLGDPSDRRFVGLVAARGLVDRGNSRLAYRRVGGGTSNRWIVVAVAPRVSGLSALPIVAVLVALLGLALLMGGAGPAPASRPRRIRSPGSETAASSTRISPGCWRSPTTRTPSHSASTTSMDSRTTTTRSATRPEMRSWRASAPAWPPWRRAAAHTAWAGTSSVS